MKVVLDRDYVVEKLQVNGQPYVYKQVENSFTQPNAKVAEKMLEWAVDCTQESKGDLLELYCGNGNFSLALAQNFERVLATELAKPSVEAAQFNIAANQIGNVQIIRMSGRRVYSGDGRQTRIQSLEGCGSRSAKLPLQHYFCRPTTLRHGYRHL